MILELEKNLKTEIDKLTNEAFKIFDLNKPQPGIDKLIEAYNNIPEPRNQYSDSFNLLKYISIGYFRAGLIDKSEKWLINFLKCDFNIMNYGESEYLAGKIALKKNNKKLALQNFLIANHKSEGRVFLESGEDKEYYDFFKANAKEKMRPTNFDEILSTALVEISNKNYRYALSLLYDALNQELGNEIVHLNKGICHFELDEYDFAADSLTRAYMLEGEEIFKQQDKKYFKFLKTKIKI